jgi:hypothetical protein
MPLRFLALRFLAPALFAIALCGAPLPASAQSFSDTQRGDIEAIVRNYLIAHPEVLEEAMAELTKRQSAAEAEKHEKGVANNADAIFNSPRGVTSATRTATSPSSSSSTTIAATANARWPT